jgi:hypothetical protein
MKLIVPAALALFLLPAPAHAQVPRQQTREEVIVTQSTTGEEIRGQIVEFSSTTLALLANGRRIEVPIDRVLRIEARTDSVKNGALIGAAVMGGLAALGCASVSGPGDRAVCAWGAAVNLGFGALAGAGIDALHKGRSTIYSKPSPIAMAVAPARQGARGQIRISW